MSHVQALGYFGLRARDLDAWERYATDVLGAQAIRGSEAGQDADTLYLRIDERDHRVAIRPGDDELDYVGWQVAGAESLDALVRDLEAAGVAVKEDPALARLRGVHRLVTCTDPSGFTLEFFFGAKVPKQPFVSPTGVKFVTRAPDGTDLGVGHIVFGCENLEEAMAFYHGVLGFKISDYIVPIPDLVLTFLHVNPRHHSLALAPLMNTAKPALNHFMLEVDSVDAVGRALEKVQDNNIRQQATLGRHTNDQMLSFYMDSPSGFGVEYGAHGFLIDDTKWNVTTYDAASFWGHKFDRS